MAKDMMTVSVVLTPEMKKYIQTLAKQEDRSFSYIARRLLEVGLQKRRAEMEAERKEVSNTVSE